MRPYQNFEDGFWFDVIGFAVRDWGIGCFNDFGGLGL